MATRKGRGRRKGANAGPPAGETPAGLDGEELEALNATAGTAEVDEVLGELEGDESRFVVSIWRRVETGHKAGKPEYLGRLGITEFSLDTIKDRWGGGYFELRVLRRNELGREVYHRTVSRLIAGAPRSGDAFAGAAGLPAGGPVAVVPAPGAAPGDPRLDALERQNRGLRKLLRRTLRRLQTPASASPLDMLEKVGAIVQSFAGPRRGGGDETFMRALELGLKLGEGRESAGAGGGFDKFLEGVAPGISAMLANGNPSTAAGVARQVADARTPRAQTAPVAAIPENGAASASTPPAAAKVVPVWLQRVAPYFGVLHAWATAGQEDAADRARMVLAMLPRSDVDELATAAEAEDFAMATLAILPPPFRAPNAVTWTTRFLEALQRELWTDSDEPGEEREGEGGEEVTE